MQEFGSLVPSQALPGKRAFGNLQPQFVEERKAARGETLDKLKYVGLRVVKQKSRDGKRMFVKLTAPQSRQDQEAERLEIDKKLSSSRRKEGKNERVAYEAFTRAKRRMFARKPATCISASGGLR